HAARADARQVCVREGARDGWRRARWVEEPGGDGGEGGAGHSPGRPRLRGKCLRDSAEAAAGPRVTPLPPAGVQLVHFLTDGAIVERDGRAASSFRHRAFYVGRDMRELARTSQVDYVPLSLAEIPRLLEHRRLALDVALVQVSPPDDDGICSLG